MLLTIDVKNGLVAIDGDVRADLDLSSLPLGDETVRWYGDTGVVDYRNADSVTFLRKRRIASLADYQSLIDQFAIPAVVVPVPDPTPLELLDKLDADHRLTQRNLRDFIKLTVEALKLGAPVDLTAIPGVQKVIAVEAQAAALRAQL